MSTRLNPSESNKNLSETPNNYLESLGAFENYCEADSKNPWKYLENPEASPTELEKS